MKSSKKLVTIFLPIICGLTVANMYYIQSIFPSVMKDIKVSYDMVSMIYTISLIGNVSALIFITPLGDFLDRRKIIALLFLLLFVSNVFLFFSSNIYAIYICAYFLGAGVSIIPITIGYLSTNKDFGVPFIGKIMSGVLLGALFSRFLSSTFTSIWNWNSIYLFSAVMMLVSFLCINKILPKDIDKTIKGKEFNYLKIIFGTLIFLVKDKNVRRFSLYGFMVMGIFSAFWNNVSIYLSEDYHLNQIYIGLFSLTGVAGVSAAMFSNNILNKINHNGKLLFLMLLLPFIGFYFIKSNIILLAIGAIVIDAMIQLIHVNNQSNIYKDCSGNESRAASCYMTLFIVGGIIGSKFSSYLYVNYGWVGICILCSIIAAIGFLSSKNTDRESFSH